MNKQHKELAEVMMLAKLYEAMHKAGIEMLDDNKAEPKAMSEETVAEEATKLMNAELDKAIYKAGIDMLEEAVGKALVATQAADKAIDEADRLAKVANEFTARVAKVLELLDDD